MKAKPPSIWQRSSSRLVCLLLAALVSCTSSDDVAKKTGDAPKILNFYAAPPLIAKGEESLLCYGTESAAEVKIEPAVESLKPALTRCFNVKPETTTDYTLTASGSGGAVSQKLTVTVRGVKKPEEAAAELIRFFVSDTQEASPGAKVTLCYGLRNAVSVSMTPGNSKLPVADRHCLSLPIARTTTFTLQAKGAGGVTDTMALTVKVRQ
ncbi:MAG: hypothetical protein SFV51_14040 [Bryobacteraceae bacterium]|nr:hypothetical protein [Bryobacteraceae bacterium]